MSDLKLSGEANGIIQFEATFRAQSIGRGIASATGNALSNVPANTPSTPFLYGAATVSLSNSASNLISFNLSLSKSFVDDRITYQNSATKLAEIITGYSGSWEYSTAYDDVNDPLMELIIGSTAANDTLELNSGAVEWTIVVNYVLDEFTLADADKSLFESKFTCRLAFDDSTQPFTVTVT